MTKGDECTVGAVHTTEIEALKVSDVKQWEAIDQIQNRLPVWATLVISLLTFLCGILGSLRVK